MMGMMVNLPQNDPLTIPFRDRIVAGYGGFSDRRRCRDERAEDVGTEGRLVMLLYLRIFLFHKQSRHNFTVLMEIIYECSHACGMGGSGLTFLRHRVIGTTQHCMLTCMSSAIGSLDLISLIGFTLDFTKCQSCFVKFAEPLLFRLRLQLRWYMITTSAFNHPYPHTPASLKLRSTHQA